MNEEELLNLGGNANDVTQAKDEAESKDKLYDEVDNLDRQARRTARACSRSSRDGSLGNIQVSCEAIE